MIELEITEKMIERSKNRSESMGELNNSITHGDGNIYGFLGEEIVKEFLGGSIKDTYEYDILVKGRKIDVKTKRCTSKPRPYYECSVASYNTQQDCDEYLFVRVLEDMTVGWILGYLPKEEFYSKATFYKKGTVDHTNGFRFHCDTYNIPIRELNQLGTMEKYE